MIGSDHDLAYPMPTLVEVAPGKWRVFKLPAASRRAELPMPNVISDTMEPVEQVDGKFYTSKAKFRAVGRALGLTEVGNEKPKPRARSSISRESRAQRRRALERAVTQYRAGRRASR